MRPSHAPAESVPTGLELTGTPANEIRTGQYAVVPKVAPPVDPGERAYIELARRGPSAPKSEAERFVESLEVPFKRYRDEVLSTLGFQCLVDFTEFSKSFDDSQLLSVEAHVRMPHVALVPNLGGRNGEVLDRSFAALIYAMRARLGVACDVSEEYGLITPDKIEGKPIMNWVPYIYDGNPHGAVYPGDKEGRILNDRLSKHEEYKKRIGLSGMDRALTAASVASSLILTPHDPMGENEYLILDKDPLAQKRIPRLDFSLGQLNFDTVYSGANGLRNAFLRLVAEGKMIPQR